MSETNAQYLKRLRVAAAEKGLCYVCRCRPAKEGCRNCQECIDKAQEGNLRIQRKNRAAGLCSCGRQRLEGMATCQRCHDNHLRIKQEMVKFVLSIGLCGTCHGLLENEDRTSCAACRLAAARRTAIHQGRPVRSTVYRCSICRELGHNRQNCDAVKAVAR